MASDEKKPESGGEAVTKDEIEEVEKEIVPKKESENGESVELAKGIGEVKVEEVAKDGEDVKMEEVEKIEEEEKGKEKEKEKETVTPRERPSRERKAVDRYWVASPASRSSSGKPISIEKGSGTPLRDIPNVAFKLSKRKPDDNLQLLHTILFGKKAKVHTLKRDIGQFSGFVWTENEEKQRAKMKEKLDKCVKEKLLHFCDVLNIPINKSSVKKEDLTVKLLEFLESPHATTEELLAEKDQKGKGQKRKATSKKSSSSKTESAEKLDKKAQSGEKRKQTSKADEDNETDNKDDDMESQSHSSEDEGDAVEKQENEEEETESEEEKEESKEKTATPKSSYKVNSENEGGKKSTTTKKRSPEKSSKSPAKSEKKTVVKTKKSADADASASSSKAKGSTNKKQKVEETKKDKPVPTEDKPANKKRERKPAPKEKGKGKTKKEAKNKNEPTNEELRAQAVNILKEVDFNTATLSDILRLLGSHFGLDLMHRKVEVKAIITDVIESMSNSDDDEEDEDSDADAAQD